MALHDHRVFKAGEDWWVAQVHSGSGAGWASEGSHPRITHERVLFRCLTCKEQMGRAATIPVGRLITMSHSSIVGVLERSEPMDHGLSMAPYNAPARIDFSPSVLYVDQEGLEWAVMRSSVVRLRNGNIERIPSVRLLCLDDTALQREIIESDASGQPNAEFLTEELIQEVKNSFPEWPNKPYELEDYR